MFIGCNSKKFNNLQFYTTRHTATLLPMPKSSIYHSLLMKRNNDSSLRKMMTPRSTPLRSSKIWGYLAHILRYRNYKVYLKSINSAVMLCCWNWITKMAIPMNRLMGICNNNSTTYQKMVIRLNKMITHVRWMQQQRPPPATKCFLCRIPTIHWPPSNSVDQLLKIPSTIFLILLKFYFPQNY